MSKKRGQLDRIAGRKLLASAALPGPAIAIIHIAQAMEWYPPALSDPESVSIVVGGLTWITNAIRKLLQRFEEGTGC